MNHLMQNGIVAALVVACALYAAWALMPAVARRALAASLLKLPALPAPVIARLRKAATSGASGCGCDGCDAGNAAPGKAAGAPQVVTFHRRPPRA